VAAGVLALSGCADEEPQWGPSPSVAWVFATDGVFAGDVVEHDTGPVQVEITVADGEITQVRALQQPDELPRSVEINTEAIPVLNDRALDAQSSHLEFVTGATQTSEAYVTSLQSAIDQAVA
jgi:uncharacterized protein with FMN-binding domain